MATRKSTTRQTESRRRAKLAKVMPTAIHTPPLRTTESERLMRLLVRALHLQEATAAGGYHDQASASHDAAMSFATSLSYLPPTTPAEVLTAACLLFDEARDTELAPNWTERLARSTAERMARRAAGIAHWIETAFQLDRKAMGLDTFCGYEQCQKVPLQAPMPAWCEIDDAIRRQQADQAAT